MRSRGRLRKVLFWGAFLALTVLAGGLFLGYVYVTDGTALGGLIEAEVPRYLPGTRLVVGRVKPRLFAGAIDLGHLNLTQVIDGVPFNAVRIPWLRVRNEARALLRGEFVMREVQVAQPVLRLCRRKDGTWNLQGLLADPWPGPFMETPPILIQNGTVELAEARQGGGTNVVAILREVSVRVESAGPKRLQFEGTARGDAFDRLGVRGTVDLATGRVTFKGDVARLALSETLRARIPADLRPKLNRMGLTAGEVDVQVGPLTYDPAATPRVRYRAAAQLRGGTLNCPNLPFPITDLSASLAVRDGALTIERAEGYNGTTVVRVQRSTFATDDPARGPLDLRLDVVDLELNERLRAWTPPPYDGLWEEYSPSGRLSVALRVVRERAGGPVGFGMGVDCRDVALVYKYFPYPVDHVHGRIIWEGRQVKLDLQTLVGGKPLRASGTIEDPGDAEHDTAHAMLDFEGEALPIDRTLFDALPPDIRKVVDDFQPSGTVKGKVHVDRMPPRPGDPPEGIVKVDAELFLNPGCAMKWKGLPYPVTNLTGRLELHPDRWIFDNMRGSNGQASITGRGKVEQVGPAVPGTPPPLKIDLHLNAERLPFDKQLRDALPQAWQKTWATLNPIGSCDVDATILGIPGKPERYYLKIDPGPSTSIRPRFDRVHQKGDLGGMFEMRMEDIRGRFVFDDGTVWMSDVGFQFHDSPVQFARGKVVVEDSGRFALEVSDLLAKDFRVDDRLRAQMPPVMKDFSRRLDDGKTFRVRGNLKLGWSGRVGEPAYCAWDNALVVFNGNTIQAGEGLALEHLQGQLDHVSGRSDGYSLEVHGALSLASVSLLGQQVTVLESPLDVKNGVAGLGNIRGRLLDGELTGAFEVSLDATPRYRATLNLAGADLRRFTRTIPGRQHFSGQVSGRVAFEGRGSDLRTIQGRGEAQISRGDLGQLPGFLALLKVLRLSPATKTAFDSADVAFRIDNGMTRIDPIRFTGDAFSLRGRGTLDVQGDLDLRLQVVLGRDRFHLFFVSDALREASGQFFLVRITGTPSYPKPEIEPLPTIGEGVRAISSRRAAQRGEPAP